jgi:hypothetical protein
VTGGFTYFCAAKDPFAVIAQGNGIHPCRYRAATGVPG